MTSQRAVLRSPGFVALLALTAIYVTGIMILVSVTPLWVIHDGGTTLQSGLVAATFPVAIVVTLLFVPLIAGRIGVGPAMRIGVLALALPSVFMVISGSIGLMIPMTAIRGFGCAILTVLGGASLIELVDVERRASAAAMYSLAVTIPSLVAVPLSVWAADVLGFRVVLCAAAVPIVGLIPVRRLAQRMRAAHPGPSRVPHGPDDLSRTWVLRNGLRPAIVVFAVSASIGGGAVTFLPQAADSPRTASIALLLLGSGTAVGRWGIGATRRRVGSSDAVALATTGLGLGALAVACDPVASMTWLVTGAVVLCGLGYGALQGSTLVASFHSVPPIHYGTASALWTFATNVGMAAGAALLSTLADVASFSLGFWILAALTLAAAPLAARRPRDHGPSTARLVQREREALEVRPECS